MVFILTITIWIFQIWNYRGNQDIREPETISQLIWVGARLLLKGKWYKELFIT